MEQFRLIFPDLKLLWSFARTLNERSFDLDTDRCMLFSKYSDEDIRRAVKEFEAIALRNYIKMH